MEEEGVAPLGAARLAVVLALLTAVVALAALPGLVATSAPATVGQRVASVLAGLVAVVGGVKLVAVAWGLASRLAAGNQARRAAAVGD